MRTHRLAPRLLALASLALVVFAAGPTLAAGDIHLDIELERKALYGREYSTVLRLTDSHAQPLADRPTILRPVGRWTADGEPVDALLLRSDDDGRIELEGVVIEGGGGRFSLELEDGQRVDGDLRVISRGWVIVPPLLAILLALLFRQVVLALAAGVWIGAWILYGNPAVGFLRSLDRFVVNAVTDDFQATMILFTASMGGMVGVMARGGGTLGVVELVSRWIKGVRSAQVMTWLMGLIIFFDDYTNTLVVGNTMRPITDRLRISREKLSYIVDSTAAPVTTIAVISTWVGYQVSLIRSGLEDIGADPSAAYGIFLTSIPYSAYSWFALVLVLMLALSGRDFGPMLTAERRARETGELVRTGGTPLLDEVGSQLAPVGHGPARAHQAFLPVLVLLVASLLGLYFDGRASLLAELGEAGLSDVPLRDYISNADPARALFWAAILGSITAIVLTVAERTLSLARAVDSWISGCKAMLTALMILILAWSIKDVSDALGTGPVVVDWATGSLAPIWLPTVSFCVAAFIGFSTGTSWAAMAILMPIVIALGHELPAAAGLSAGQAQSILVSSIASVLSGSVWGDHCSPISDTTIMSSMASGADHVDHVRTQLPYALVAGCCAVVLGTLPAGLGITPWLTLPLGFVVLVVITRFVGKKVSP